MTSVTAVTILGATGSIGTQAIDIVRAHPERFSVCGLSAGGTHVELLARQAAELDVDVVAVADESQLDNLAAALAARGANPEILAGPNAATELAARPCDLVLNGITGSVGLGPTLAALAAGTTLALANKESLVAGGALVKQAQVRANQIVPVDSEHSAIAQCLRAGQRGEVRRLVVTASGGPFRGWSRAQLRDVTPDEALRHPNFAMGTVITTNSATLVNKGLEVIEAHLLFDIPIENVDVVVHPQQLIHSMVEFCDGAVIAQAGLPRMLVPIALAMSWPERLCDVDQAIDWTRPMSWQFEPLDETAFPAVRLARQAVAAGATHPAVYNAANEQAVAAFHRGRITFPQIVETVEATMAAHDGPAPSDLTVDDLMQVEQWAREWADGYLARG